MEPLLYLGSLKKGLRLERGKQPSLCTVQRSKTRFWQEENSNNFAISILSFQLANMIFQYIFFFFLPMHTTIR